ncbi:hypothetical protein K1719_009315 [Acacia pycnantha]|nr:hypothetical protein K1719_009315 [Acacia pycnantha]
MVWEREANSFTIKPQIRKSDKLLMLLCTLPALFFKLLNTTHSSLLNAASSSFSAQSLSKKIHIRTYLDYQIPKRHEVSHALLRAIEDAFLKSCHVRNHIALYEQAFEKFESCLKVDQHKLQIWKHDLNEAANLDGDDSHTLRQASSCFSATLDFLTSDPGPP